jgi:hypothetical protein
MLLYARSYCPPTTKKAWGLQINLDITVKIFLLITISQTLFFFPCARGKNEFYRHEIAFLIFFPRSAVWYYKIKLWITLFLGLKFYFIFFLFWCLFSSKLYVKCELVCESKTTFLATPAKADDADSKLVSFYVHASWHTWQFFHVSIVTSPMSPSV